MKKDSREPRFGTLGRNVLGLIFENVRDRKRHHFSLVNKNWAAGFRYFDRDRIQLINNFINNFPRLASLIKSHQHLVKDWREELYWVTQFAKYFPIYFRNILNEEMIHTKEEWIGKWRERFNILFEGHDLYVKNKYKNFFLALAECDIDKLDDFIVSETYRSDFRIETILNGHLFEIGSQQLSKVMGEKVWQLITKKFENKEMLPFWAIVTHQSEEIIIQQIQSVANVNTPRAWEGRSLLHCAAEKGCLQVVKFLLARQADVNPQIEFYGYNLHREYSHVGGSSPLHLACQGGHLEIASLLLDNQADVNATRVDGITPLHDACVMGCSEVVELLLNRGANVDAFVSLGAEDPMSVVDDSMGYASEWGITSLHVACQRGDFKIAKLLLDHQADVNCPRTYNITPLHDAVQQNHAQIVELLLDRQADVNAKVEESGSTPLHWVCEYGSSLAITKLLVAKQAEVNAKNAWHQTPLDLICEEHQLELCQFLIDHGANLFIVDPFTDPEYTDLKRDDKIKKFLIIKSIEQMQIGYNNNCDTLRWNEILRYQKKLARQYSLCIVPLCKDDVDFLLLFAIFTRQSFEEIQRVIDLGANPLGSDVYTIKPIELAQLFYPDVSSLISDSIQRNQNDITQFSDPLLSTMAMDIEDDLIPDFESPDSEEEESAGYDSLTKRKRNS